MQFIKPNSNINFIGKKKMAFALSLTMIIATFILLIYRGGPNYGVDFSGGVLAQVKLAQEHSPKEIKEALVPVDLGDSIIQEFGEKGKFEYLIRIRGTGVELSGLSTKIEKALTDKFGHSVDMRRVEMVGPKVGEDLRQKALFAIFYAMLFIAIYISGRFELKWLMSIVMALSLAFVVYITSSIGMSVTWLIFIALIVTVGLCFVLRLKFALGALIALMHDVIITIGVFALTDREISLSIIAAFLTIVGYSLNDTIIVFDRIRENSKRFRKRPFPELMNTSINETLSRTILTSITTLVVIIFLYVFGGGVIHDFAFAMMIGVVVGTYSSIFVASPILLLWEGRFEKSGKQEKDLLSRILPV